MAEELDKPDKPPGQTEPQTPPLRSATSASSGISCTPTRLWRKVRESIQSRVEAFGLGDRVGRSKIPPSR